MNFYPEGLLLDTEQNRAKTADILSLKEAATHGDILEGRAIICDSCHNLAVELPSGIKGVIPREEGAVGIETGQTRDIAIISRVNKAVSFIVTGFDDSSGKVTPVFSRRLAQQRCYDEYISRLTCGDVISVKVTHLEPFGAFVDIGCGISSMIPIDSISISRIPHPSERFYVGQNIYAVVRSVENNRLSLSHKELLGTWQQNACNFSPGETVAGIVRSLEQYGIFVELTPNLAGLAEYRSGVRCGMHTSVYIKNLLPARMKIKLIIIDAFPADYPPVPLEYYITGGHINSWRYSPNGCEKVIETNFQI